MFIYAAALAPGGAPDPSELSRAVATAVSAFPALTGEPASGVSASGRLSFAGVGHPEAVAAPRRYLARGERHVVILDGLPVHPEGRFAAHDAAVLLERWDEARDSLEGIFSATRIDLETDAIECIGNVMGLAKVFALRHRGGWLVSNSVAAIRAIAGVSAPDPLGVSGLLTLGWPVDRTLIEEIRPLEAGHLHRLTPGGIESRPQLTPATVARGTDGAPESLPELAESLKRMTAAAASAVRPLTCPLTAGRDSRVLISLLLAAGIEPDCYTTGHPGELDVEVSRELAERLDLPYRVETPEVPADRQEWVETTARFVAQTDGLASLYGISDHVDHPRPVERLGLKVWGPGGEVASLGRLDVLIPLAATLPGARASWKLQKRVMATKLSGAGAIASPAAVELARGYVEEFAEARRAEGWRARDALETYYAFERVRNWAATGLRRQSACTDLFSPYVSRDFVRYAFSRPQGERLVETTHYGLQTLLRPDIRDIPGKEPWHPQWPRLAPMLAVGMAVRETADRVGRKALRRDKPLVTRIRYDKDAPPPFGRLWLEAGIEPTRELCASFPQSPLWELIDRRALESVLSGPAAARASNDYGLAAAMTALWYFHGPEAVGPPSGAMTAEASGAP